LGVGSKRNEHGQQDWIYLPKLAGEQMPGSKPTIKQKLAAIRMLYDFLVIRQLVPLNPTASVRGPEHVVKRGKTPVWSREDAKKLLESIPRDDLAGLRDRALISTMLFSFARISAVLSLKRQDFYYQGPRRWLRFHEKGLAGTPSDRRNYR
jgi:integrase/recombinase XerD